MNSTLHMDIIEYDIIRQAISELRRQVFSWPIHLVDMSNYKIG